MIGPHEGKELELMLEGKKHLAIFYDALIEGQSIPEEIIPEKAFAPYVRKGLFTRTCKTVTLPKSSIPAFYVCFTQAGEEWRAQAFFWMQQECLEGRRPYDDAYEYFIGRLLGYEEEDIRDFIENVRYNLRKQSGQMSS